MKLHFYTNYLQITELNGSGSPQGEHYSHLSPTNTTILMGFSEVTATCRKQSLLHSSNSATAHPANKLQTQFKATAKAFKIQVSGRWKQGKKKLKVLINCSLGQFKKKKKNSNQDCLIIMMAWNQDRQPHNLCWRLHFELFVKIITNWSLSKNPGKVKNY